MKEKAKELVDKFMPAEYRIAANKGICYMQEFEQAKQCALIALDMVIESNPTKPERIEHVSIHGKTISITARDCNKQHYIDLKKEVEKL